MIEPRHGVDIGAETTFKRPTGPADDITAGVPVLRVIVGPVICRVHCRVESVRAQARVSNGKIARLSDAVVAFDQDVIIAADHVTDTVIRAEVVVDGRIGQRQGTQDNVRFREG